MMWLPCITQTFGFITQTLPIIMLAYVPFSESELRAPRARITWMYCLAIFAASVIFTAASVLMFRAAVGAETLRMFGNIYMALFMFVCSVLYALSVSVSPLKKLLVLVLLIHYAAIMFTITDFITVRFDGIIGVDTGLIYSYSDLFCYVLLTAVTCPFVFMFLRRIVMPCLPAMESKSLRHGCMYLVTVLLLYCVCVFLLSAAYYNGLEGWDLIACLGALMITDVLAYYMFFAEARIAAENIRLAGQLRSFDEQYRLISSSAGEFRRFRHDMRHHLNVISTLNREGKSRELAEYLERYTESYQELERRPLSGYLALDTVLRYYMDRAESQGMKVETDICTLHVKIGFDVIDITVLIGNLLENAINACVLGPEEGRFIRVTVRSVNMSLLLLVENSCPEGGVERAENGDETPFVFQSSGFHGQGLRSIRMVAEKYGGSAEYKKAGSVFSARVVLNLP